MIAALHKYNHDGTSCMADYHIVERLVRNPGAERDALAQGLVQIAAAIPPRYFYDALGCALFGAICELPEYYPTRTERAIFSVYREEIADAVGRGRQFVDLGAGDCCKALAWLPYLEPARYIAVDIARDEIAASLAKMSPEFPEVDMLGIVVDFTHGLDLEQDLDGSPVTFFYPGSSIGNFTPAEARSFLQAIRLHCAGRADSGLLIGVDTKKDKARLDAAYDDAVGVTAAFNRNVLNHVNRVLDPQRLPARGLCTSWFLQRGRGAGGDASRGDVAAEPCVGPVGARRFVAGERIHTENSYKYAPRNSRQLLHEAGFDNPPLLAGRAARFLGLLRRLNAVAREPQAGELPARLRREEIAIRGAKVRRGRGAGAPAQHELVHS